MAAISASCLHEGWTATRLTGSRDDALQRCVRWELRLKMRVMKKPLLILLALAIGLSALAPPAGATFPGRNAKIAFVRDGNIEIVRPDGSGERVLPLGRGNVGQPSWSPSGSRLAFTCRPPRQQPDICVARADGSRRRQLTENEVTDEDPSWSPDGRSLLFTRSEGPFAVAGDFLIVLDVETKTERTLLYRPDGIFHPRWSPHGSTIVYGALGVEARLDIFTTPADGSGGETNLTNSPELETSPSWSPDSTLIAFDRYIDTADVQTQRYAIFTMKPDGSEQTMAVRSGNGPVFSPNGRRIAFFDLVNNDYDAIFTSRATGGDRRRLTGPPRRGSFSPDWQPR